MQELLKELLFETILLDEKSRQPLYEFLFAGMDEVRMNAQNRFSISVLKKTNMEDWEYFRESLVKREFNNIISYDRQRDHASHTVYNYLLGKYIFYKTDIVKKVLNDHSLIRRIQNHNVFESLWPFVSLLHDIGYMFEGSISKKEVTNNNELIRLGVDILNAYFESIFWVVCGNNSTPDKKYLEEYAKIKHAFVNPNSIYTIINSLRSLDSLEMVKENTNELMTKNGIDTIKTELSSDVFDIWIENLEYYSLQWKKFDKRKIKVLDHNEDHFTIMKKKIIELKNYFTDVHTKGYKGLGVRNIDHAVASGLILLKCSTLFFQIFHAIELKNPKKSKNSNQAIKNFIQKLKRDSKRNNFESDLLWWWQGIIWATMSAAYHNFPMMKKYWPNKFKCDKLKIENDPLTYLGLLVDILQEWDRYSSSPDLMSENNYPLQGRDMRLHFNKTKKIVEISYPKTFDNKEFEEIKNKLNENLIDWNKIIIIKRHQNNTYKKMIKEDKDLKQQIMQKALKRLSTKSRQKKS